ncbi:hypothetical protein [Alicyclobacillus macrosporangiidus]|uniref:hypothetical protein n=1 Tax=Alicyclobacillus macrosporangiidus TaxID=392015 RepID=UPI0012DFB31D|nr:hypothetical protein [Alicyclobacillus macrosporangiidus]
MAHPHDRSQKSTCSTGSSWALFGIPIVAILCCGLPVLLTALGLTAAGAFLEANRYFILGGMVLLMGVMMFIGSRRGKHCGHGACCMPNTNQTPHTPQDER